MAEQQPRKLGRFRRGRQQRRARLAERAARRATAGDWRAAAVEGDARHRRGGGDVAGSAGQRRATSASGRVSLDEAARRCRGLSFDRDELWLPTPDPAGGWQATRLRVHAPDSVQWRANPLHDTTKRTRTLLAGPHDRAGARAVDRTVDEVEAAPRVGFSERALPEPRGPLTGLDTGGSGGSGFPTVEPSHRP